MNIRKNISKYAEQLFTIISLFLYSGALLPLVLSGGISQGDGRERPADYPAIQLIFLVIYIITACLLFKHWQNIINLLIKEKYILLLISLALVSVLWSELPIITIKRSIALTGTTLFGLYFALRYPIKEQLKLLGWTFGLVISLSFIFVVAFPEYGIMGGVHQGIWRGIYTHKNSLGNIMALSSIVFLLLAVDIYKYKFILWLGFSFSIILLLFSTSKTALVSCAIVLTFLCIYWIWYKYYKAVLPTLMAIILIGGNLFLQVSADFFLPIALSNRLSTEVIINNSQVTQQTPSGENKPQVTQQTPSGENKPQVIQQAPSVDTEDIKTFTGRTKLWSIVWEMIKKRPWFGYGYGGFWNGWDGPSAQVWRTELWKPPHAHNGFLDIGLNLGLLGVSMFLIGLFINLFRISNLIVQSKISQYLFLATYLMYFTLANLTETSVLKHNNLLWVLYVAITFSISILIFSSEPRKNKY
jgi:O-antigen ligase